MILPSRKSSPTALAELALARRKVEHVVDQLEGDAEIAAEPFERLLLRRRALGDDRADAARRREQRRGLRLDDLEIGGLGRRRVVGGDQLPTSPSAITAAARDRISRTRSEPSSTISSNERANRKSPTSTAGLLPHTALAVSRPRRRSLAVDDVVVQQGRGVDEFDGGGERDMPLAADSRTAGRSRGSASAAAACRRPRRYGRRAAGSAPPGCACASTISAIDPVEIGGEQPEQRVERRLREPRGCDRHLASCRHQVLLARVSDAVRPRYGGRTRGLTRPIRPASIAHSAADAPRAERASMPDQSVPDIAAERAERAMRELFRTQRRRPPVLGAGAAARCRHRQPRSRPSYQPRRRQHRGDPAAPDGRRARSSAAPAPSSPRRRRSCAERRPDRRRPSTEDAPARRARPAPAAG